MNAGIIRRTSWVKSWVGDCSMANYYGGSRFKGIGGRSKILTWIGRNNYTYTLYRFAKSKTHDLGEGDY